MYTQKTLQEVKNLVQRNKDRLTTKYYDPKFREKEELLFWVLSLLYLSINGKQPASGFHCVYINEIPAEDGSVLLEYKKSIQYKSRYVGEKDFYKVIEDVANILNELGNDSPSKFTITAIAPIKEGSAALIVRLFTK